MKSVSEVFQFVNSGVEVETVKDVEQAMFKFVVKESESTSEEWYVSISKKSISATNEKPEIDPVVTYTMDTETFSRLVEGALKPNAAFLTGKLTITGDIVTALNIDAMLDVFRKSDDTNESVTNES